VRLTSRGVEVGEAVPVQDSQPVRAVRRELVTPVLQARPGKPVVVRRLLAVREAAGLLGVSTATVHALCGAERLIHVRVSNALRIPPEEIVGYLGTSAAE
jgi:hypothetical protein